MEALQGWRGSEGELVLAMATAELQELGGCACGSCGRRRRSGKMKLRALGVAGRCWRDEGALGRVVAWLGRAKATRGRFPLHAAAKA